MARKNLTPKAKGYVENVSKGIPKDRSAIMAGATTDAVKSFDANPLVQTELTRIRREAVENTGVTKEKVVEMFMEAANFARILGDPMGLIAAARELGKMLGHYAPEVKKTLHGIDEAGLKKALKELNDDELYKLVHARTIDGESVRLLPEKRTGSVVLQETQHLSELPDPSRLQRDPGTAAGETPERKDTP